MYYWNWPWSTSCPVTLVVSALGCLPHLPFGAIGILGPHDAECTLELHMQPHWLVLVLPLEDGLVVENIAQVWFGMLMFALPSWGYHAVLRLIMTGSLTCLLEYCDGFCGWFCSWWPPHILSFFWRGVCYDYVKVCDPFLSFGFTKFGVNHKNESQTLT